jgi:hypothetical protein
MIRGVERKSIPYVVEDDRSSSLESQTVFWVIPKTGEDNNKTLRRYASTYKDGRRGGREVDDRKLNAADVDEFLYLVEKVENYGFPKDHKLYDSANDPIKEITDKGGLIEVARTLSADHLAEIFEVANNISKLTEGAKKNSN